MNNISKFTGTTKNPIDPDRILSAAIGQLESVIIIGRDQSGDLYFASSDPDISEVNLNIDRVKFNILSGEYDL